jgi:DNA-binding NarL/FixJ family response regulator
VSIRILIADDHPLVRAGIQAELSTESNIIAVGEATNGYEAQQLTKALNPDVLLLDVNMPGPHATETAAYVRKYYPHTRVLILTAYDDDVYVQSLIAAGAAGYVLKDEATETLMCAIRNIMRGDMWFSWPVMKKLVNLGVKTTAPQHEHGLTAREQQILAMIAEGWDNTYIASKLSLAVQTVRNYVSRIYIKLGVSSRPEAIVYARRQGLMYQRDPAALCHGDIFNAAHDQITT